MLMPVKIHYFVLILLSVFTVHASSFDDINAVYTPQEIHYLKEKKQITMCIDPEWMPFEKIENGQHVGMTAEYFALIQKEVGIPIVVIPTTTWSQSIEFAKKRQCDIFSLAMETKERKEYMNFTSAYLEAPLVIATRMNTLFIANPQEVINQPLGITKGYAYITILKEKYPSINLVEFETLDKGLEALRKNEIFGYIDNLITSGYKIQQKYFGELKIAGKFDDQWALGIGVRNDDLMLLQILEKAIKLVKHDEYMKIINKWVSIKYESGIDYTLLWQIVGGFTFLILFGVYRHIELNRLIKALKQKDVLLQKLSITDPLSGLFNRRHFSDVFSREYDRAKRLKQPFVFAMIDIDFFKKYNDTYGHHAGDEVIVKVSQVLKENTKRAGDYAFRLGGEEFGIILQTEGLENCEKHFEAMRQSVEALNIEHTKSPKYHKLTLSMGVVKVVHYADMAKDFIYKTADEQLYQSKEKGRNEISYITL
jgi:polar amino acid transport system substrate-binding protein